MTNRTVTRFAPAGYTTEEQVDTLIRLTERSCVVLRTIADAPELTVSGNAARPVVNGAGSPP